MSEDVRLAVYRELVARRRRANADGEPRTLEETERTDTSRRRPWPQRRPVDEKRTLDRTEECTDNTSSP